MLQNFNSIIKKLKEKIIILICCLIFQVVITNGIISITLSKPGGYVKGISYSNIDNVLETRYEENDRGYLDVAFGKKFQRLIILIKFNHMLIHL